MKRFLRPPFTPTHSCSHELVRFAGVGSRSMALRVGYDRNLIRFATVNWERKKDGVNKTRPLLHDWGADSPGVTRIEAANMNVAKKSAAFKSI